MMEKCSDKMGAVEHNTKLRVRRLGGTPAMSIAFGYQPPRKPSGSTIDRDGPSSSIVDKVAVKQNRLLNYPGLRRRAIRSVPIETNRSPLAGSGTALSLIHI